MPKILSIISFLLFFTSVKLFSQIDKNGNPVFNSVNIEKTNLDDFEIISNYYTIKDNIDNKLSSVFVRESPSIEDFVNFSTKLPSYYFMLVNHGNVQGMAMLIPSPKDDSYFYNVIIPYNNSNIIIPSSLRGKITEHRAKELAVIKNNDSKITDNQFHISSSNLEIIPFQKVLSEFKEVVVDKIKSASKTDNRLEEYIKSESKEGGKFDFKKKLEDSEGLIAYESILYNKKDFAILMWSAAVKSLGYNDFDKAKDLWKSINGRELTEPELKAFKKGFEIKLK